MKHIGIDLANGDSRIGVTYTPEQWKRVKALEAAMKGIKDPAEFVKCADAIAGAINIDSSGRFLRFLDAYEKARGESQ